MQFHPWTKNGIGPIVLFIKSPERPDLFWRSSPSSCRMHNSLLQWSHRKQFYERNNKAWEMKSTRMLQLAITALYSDLGFKPTALLSFRLSAPSLNDHMFADSNGDGCVCVCVWGEGGWGGQSQKQHVRTCSLVVLGKQAGTCTGEAAACCLISAAPSCVWKGANER